MKTGAILIIKLLLVLLYYTIYTILYYNMSRWPGFYVKAGVRSTRQPANHCPVQSSRCLKGFRGRERDHEHDRSLVHSHWIGASHTSLACQNKVSESKTKAATPAAHSSDCTLVLARRELRISTVKMLDGLFAVGDMCIESGRQRQQSGPADPHAQSGSQSRREVLPAAFYSQFACTRAGGTCLRPSLATKKNV